ncbi:MAG: hypothetical protein V3V19_05105 [Cocleimonas sp.]
MNINTTTPSFIVSALFSTLITSLFMSGCSVKSDTTKANKESLEEIYKIVAVSTTQVGKNGSPCSDAVGVIKVQNDALQGKATDSIGRRFSISGDTNRGRISGGFALTKKLAVKFTGRINKATGRANGTWKDMFQCQGTWKATRVLKRKSKKRATKSIKT